MEMLDTKYAVSSHTLDEMEQLVFDLEDSYFLIHRVLRQYGEKAPGGRPSLGGLFCAHTDYLLSWLSLVYARAFFLSS